MALIQAENLTFYYDGSFQNVFDKVSFQIDSNWKLGLTGRNGRGKTTLLKLLKGELEYRGTIKADMAFDYFPYDIINEQMITEEVIEQIKPDYELWKICRELSLLQVDSEILYRSFCTLSHGEQTKVQLAVLFSSNEHFLLIDEPTNHLDSAARFAVMKYLNKKKGFILVSHDRYFLDGCTDHIMAINKTGIDVVNGNFSSWWENKTRQDEYERSENEKLKKDIKRLEQASRQASAWADKVESTKIGRHSVKEDKNIDTRAYLGEKSRRMQKRRKNLERRQEANVEEKKGLLKNIENVDELKLFPKEHHKRELVRLNDICIRYGDKVVAENLDLIVEQKERVALRGKNGCGKSSILKLILQEYSGFNEHIEHSGKIQLASGMGVSYVAQDTSWLRGDVKTFIAKWELDESLFLTMLRKLDFSRELFHRPMQEYSQGQKKKILLARSLCEQAHLYIWDEPLNFIDIFSRMQIIELIRRYEPTLIFVEHDRYFTEETATKIFEFE